MAKKSAIWSFIRLIFGSFFRWWWVAITGSASIVGWSFLPATGISLSPLILGLLIFFGSALLFLTVTTVYQGWIIYQGNFESLSVSGFLANDCYGGEHIVKLIGPDDVALGTVVELSRFYNDAELPIALVEIVERNTLGEYQAKLIWFSPGHLNDLKTEKYACSDITATNLVRWRTIEKAKEAIWG